MSDSNSFQARVFICLFPFFFSLLAFLELNFKLNGLVREENEGETGYLGSFVNTYSSYALYGIYLYTRFLCLQARPGSGPPVDPLLPAVGGATQVYHLLLRDGRSEAQLLTA